MQQNAITLLLASFIGLFLSGYWMYNEIQFVSIMSEFEQGISWALQAPLMIFIAILILTCLILFISSLGSLDFKEIKAEIAWKRLLTLGLVFDAIIISYALIYEYLKLRENWIVPNLVAITLILVYVFGARKKGITPIFFLISTICISFVVGSIVYFVMELL